MQKDILFDNIYIGHSVADAEKLQKETYDVKIAIEKQEDEANSQKETDTPKSPMDLKFRDDPVHYMREKLNLFWTIAKRNPVEAVKFVPEVAAGIAVLAAGVLTLLFTLLGAGAVASPQVQDKAKKAKQEAASADAKDQAADVVAIAPENVQAEANKRSTRSSENAGTEL